MDEYLSFSVSYYRAQGALIRWVALKVELAEELVIEVLGGVVLVQVKLPPEEYLSARSSNVEGRLKSK